LMKYAQVLLKINGDLMGIKCGINMTVIRSIRGAFGGWLFCFLCRF